jgi:predicted DNA-binding ribbon-helix-helix protein
MIATTTNADARRRALERLADDRPERKRSVVIAGHRTSVSVEAMFWDELRRVAADRHVSLNALIAEIDSRRTGNLSSAVRVFALEQVRAAIS